MQIYWLLLGVLAVWRVTHLITAEDGPWDVFLRLRQWAGERSWANLLDCFLCLSLWLALPFSVLLGSGWKEWLLLWPALSAGAILLEHVKSGQAVTSTAYYYEDEEV